MTTTLVLFDSIEAAIRERSGLEVETAGVLLARPVGQRGDVRLLAREMHWVPDQAYLKRTRTRMTIASEGYVPALSQAEQDAAIPIWVHTHPGEKGIPLPSHWDQKVDENIADLFRLRSGSHYYGTLIFSPRGEALVFTGTLQAADRPASQIDRLWSVGTRWRMTPAHSVVEGEIDPIFDRNVRAFGPAIQHAMSMLTVGVVGAGGTGSAVAEQLVRLGVRHLILLDADSISASNVTRVYGSTPGKVGRAKVKVLRDHLKRIAPDLDCRSVNSMVTLEPAARALSSCDLIFGCTDDNAGRLVLSRLATYFLVPVIDVGVLLSSGADGVLSGIDGRITILSPGEACLVCRDRIDMARAAVELRTPDERKRLADEGYAPALGQVEPAVVAFTTAVAAAAVNELLERLIGYGAPERPSEILLRIHEREISTNRAEPRPAHYCHPSQGKWGAGNERPFLGQLWPRP